MSTHLFQAYEKSILIPFPSWPSPYAVSGVCVCVCGGGGGGEGVGIWVVIGSLLLKILIFMNDLMNI